jgi:protein MPE1
VPSESTPILEVQDLVVVVLASLIHHRLTTISLIDHCRQAMSAIAVVRKVSCDTLASPVIVSLIFLEGHWIHDCPTNNDREFDNKPRIKRTTGIPRSFLKTVDNPNSGQLAQGVMVTPEGGYVIAQPDSYVSLCSPSLNRHTKIYGFSASWQKQVSRPKGLTAADVRERTPTDSTLVCPIDNKLFRDAVKTPCCGTLYCEECIQTHLLERDFLCPNCGKKIASLDKVGMDKPMRTKVADYIDKTIEESKKDGDEEFASNGSATSANGPVCEPQLFQRTPL